MEPIAPSIACTGDAGWRSLSSRSSGTVFCSTIPFLIEGRSHRQAIKSLDRFLDSGQDFVKEPLKRAILQRDLWAIFVSTADPNLPHQVERRELQKRLAQVIRQIALSSDEIRQLPDNLQQAVRSRSFPTEYQADQSDRPFLPDDLMKANGTWVLLGNRYRRDDLAAPNHVA